jgi:hypothetical protein
MCYRGCRGVTEALQRTSLSGPGPGKGGHPRGDAQNREDFLLKLQAARTSPETQEQQQERQRRANGSGRCSAATHSHQQAVLLDL